MVLSDIEHGDQVSFFCPRLRSSKERTVRTVTAAGVHVYHGGGIYKLYISDIKSLTKKKCFGEKNMTPLSRQMFKQNVSNVALAEKAGYSVRAVCDARLGHKVKPQTMKDIQEALDRMAA